MACCIGCPILSQVGSHQQGLESAGEQVEPLGGTTLPQSRILLFASLKFPDRQDEPSEAKVSFPLPSSLAVSWGQCVSDKL
jgi:hypothetical protein